MHPLVQVPTDATNDAAQIEARQPEKNAARSTEEARELLASLSEGDRVVFNDDVWTVTEARVAEDTVFNTNGDNDPTPYVTFRALTGYHPGTTTLYPSSFRNACVTAQSRGVGPHYSSITLVTEGDN